ncbi:Sodium/hydrogen exchanger 9B2 [Coccomyxa sp. Obi]|nr:Sodium/hydrogen exchanger 9B2 [Coccomyxa sp. Obi]
MELKDVKGPIGFFKYFFQDFKLSKQELLYVTGLVTIILELYGGLFLAIGKPFLPPMGPAWAVIIIWIVAGSCGYLVDKLHFPGALGMILSGMLLRNVGGGIVIRGLRESWSKQIRAAALAIIFLRSGLEIDLEIFKRVGGAAIRLLLVPGICEALFDGGIAIPIFGMPPTFAFALGFILKAVGPALVIQSMFEVQQRRLGTVKFIPATVVAAASFDDAIAITGYTLFINLAVRGGGNTVWDVMHGPLSIVFGVLAGGLAGVFCSATNLWNNNLKRTLVMFLTVLLMKYFFDHYGFTSSGAIGALVQGLLAKELWKRGLPKRLAGESGPQMGRSVEKHVRWFWRMVMMPVMFGLVGASVNFSTIQRGIIPKSCAIIIAGLGVRMPITYMVMLGSKYTWMEKLFFAIAWSPKATVQATLANLPLDQVNAVYAPTDPQYKEYANWAEETLVTAVFCIIICGAFGTMAIRYLAPLLLEQAPAEDDPTAAIVTGPNSSGPRGAGSPDSMSPSASQVELSKRSDPDIASRQQPAASASAGPSAVGHGGGEGAPRTPRQQQLQPQLEPGTPQSPKDGESEALRSRMAMLAGYLDSVEDAASEVERKAMTVDGGGVAAERLHRSIHELRRKLQEGADPSALGPSEVESAEDFLRATALRHRTMSGRSSMSMRARRQAPEADPTKTSTNV